MIGMYYSIQILIVLFAIGSAYYDFDKSIESHTSRFILRAITVAILSAIEYTTHPFSFVLNSAIFYAIFDYTYNIFRGNDFFYIGNTAVIDRLWRKFGGMRSQLIFKITLVLIGLILYNL